MQALILLRFVHNTFRILRYNQKNTCLLAIDTLHEEVHSFSETEEIPNQKEEFQVEEFYKNRTSHDSSSGGFEVRRLFLTKGYQC